MTEAGGTATHYHQTGIKNFLLLEFFFKVFFKWKVSGLRRDFYTLIAVFSVYDSIKEKRQKQTCLKV